VYLSSAAILQAPGCGLVLSLPSSCWLVLANDFQQVLMGQLTFLAISKTPSPEKAALPTVFFS
jgi:phosphatidylinositol kinase/protein kinase (PI-3  family)